MKTIRIGRGHDNDVVLQDISVSRYHCQLMQYEDGSVVICDCGSSNGTFVNGRRIKGNTRLERSDSVRLGNVDFQWTSSVQTPHYQEPPTMYIPQESYIEPEPPRAYVPYEQQTTNRGKKKERRCGLSQCERNKSQLQWGRFRQEVRSIFWKIGWRNSRLFYRCTNCDCHYCGCINSY